MSEIKAGLKLDGEYVGIIDKFERWCDINYQNGALAEIIPDGNLQPINFFISEEFFQNPNSLADVYVSEGFRVIHIKKFMGKNASLELIWQQRFCGMTVTVYRQGGVFVSCEGESFENYPLPDEYENVRAKEAISGGKKLLALYGGRYLAVINPKGRLMFLNEAESCSFGDIIEVKAPLFSCTDSFAECAFTCDGEKFTAADSRAAERKPQGGELLPFVFFERVLYGGDYALLLCEELKSKAESLKKYLGEFTAVTVPNEDFYKAYPRTKAAGLVFKKGENLYEIVYFAIDEEDGKITNIRPV